jgi:hypothetical protein
MLRGLRDGKLHAALMIQTSGKVLDGLTFEELRRYAVCVAVHPSHPLARVRKVGLAQIVKERLVAYTLADYPEYHAWLANLFAPLKRSPQIAEEHDSSTSLIASRGSNFAPYSCGRRVRCSNSTMCRPSPRLVRTCTTSTARNTCRRLFVMNSRNERNSPSKPGFASRRALDLVGRFGFMWLNRHLVAEGKSCLFPVEFLKLGAQAGAFGDIAAQGC